MDGNCLCRWGWGLEGVWGLGKISSSGRKEAPPHLHPIKPRRQVLLWKGLLLLLPATFPTEGWGPWARQRQSHSLARKRKHQSPCSAWGWRCCFLGATQLELSQVDNDYPWNTDGAGGSLQGVLQADPLTPRLWESWKHRRDPKDHLGSMAHLSYMLL